MSIQLGSVEGGEGTLLVNGVDFGAEEVQEGGALIR